MDQNELNHEVRNALSAMGLAAKGMANSAKKMSTYVIIFNEEYERVKKAQKKLDKCKNCTKVKI